MIGGASVEDTLALWASSLREAKQRIHPLFTQERVAASAGQFLIRFFTPTTSRFRPDALVGGDRPNPPIQPWDTHIRPLYPTTPILKSIGVAFKEKPPIIPADVANSLYKL